MQRLENWAERNIMKLQKGQSKFLPLGRTNAGEQDMVLSDRVAGSFAKQDLVLLLESKLTMSQQCSLAAKEATRLQEGMGKSVASTMRKALRHLSSSPVRPLVKSFVRFEASQWKMEADMLEQFQCRATKMLKGLEPLQYEEKVRELGVFNPQRRLLRLNLLLVLNPGWAGMKTREPDYFQLLPAARTKVSGRHREEMQLSWKRRKAFSPVRVVKQWTSSRGFGFPCLEI